VSGEGIDEAAASFDTDAKTSIPSKSSGQTNRQEGPPERMFERVGELETDEDSPAQGGGDDADDPEVRTTEDEPDEEAADGEEDTDDADEGEEEGEEEAEGDADFLAQEVEVVVDGQEQSVTLKEALEGYVRTQTFHKRMNEVQEAKEIVQRVAADAVSNYEYTMQLGKEIEAHLNALVPPEPNWDEEFKKNPVRAREIQKYYDQVRGFKAELSGKLAEASKKQEESAARQTSAYAQEEARRFDSINAKQWAADPKKKTKDLQAMRRTALSQGFSEDEISQVYDSRMLQVLLKASKYDRMMASRPKPVVNLKGKRPVPSGGGSARARPAAKGLSTAMKRLNQTGKIEDAALVFDNIIRRDG